jgi:NMD protein affecting ribosome stability and mRNA decay
VNLERRDGAWRCGNCMLCSECGRADNSGKMLVCDTCDSAHHTYCLTPPLKTMPDNFRCDK